MQSLSPHPMDGTTPVETCIADIVHGFAAGVAMASNVDTDRIFRATGTEHRILGCARAALGSRCKSESRDPMAAPMLHPEPPDPLAALPEIVSAKLDADHPLRGGVLLLGNFDGFHRGHKAVAEWARRIAGGRHIAAMSCEPHPRSFFRTENAPFRLATLASKQRRLAGHGVEFIYAPRFDLRFAEMSPAQFVDIILVEALGVSQVIVGRDFRFGYRREGDRSLLFDLGRSRGFSVDCVPDVSCAGARVSSSLIRALIRAGDLRAANELLGASWLVETCRRPDGGLELHPDLCRPRPGRYLGAQEMTMRPGHLVGIEIAEDGRFIPPGQQHQEISPELWRLECPE